MVLNIRWLWVGEVHCLYLFADTIAVLFFGMRALSGNFGVRAFAAPFAVGLLSGPGFYLYSS